METKIREETVNHHISWAMQVTIYILFSFIWLEGDKEVEDLMLTTRRGSNKLVLRLRCVY